MEFCRVCSRIHNENMPCPTRVANAILMRPQAIEQLTEADRMWMNGNLVRVNVQRLLEGELATMM